VKCDESERDRQTGRRQQPRGTTRVTTDELNLGVVSGHWSGEMTRARLAQQGPPGDEKHEKHESTKSWREAALWPPVISTTLISAKGLALFLPLPSFHQNSP